jgi:hypothetical protein
LGVLLACPVPFALHLMPIASHYYPNSLLHMKPEAFDNSTPFI